MITLEQYNEWLKTYDKLTEQMKENGDDESLMVAGIMYSLRACLCNLGGQDRRALIHLFTMSTNLSQSMIDEYNKINLNSM